MTVTINHNLMAMNTARNLAKHYGQVSVSTRRLASGLRITTSADDAAGCAISELAKAKSATLQQAKRNINDGVSYAQVADGALSIVDLNLTRLKELAAQAATGTYSSDQRNIISSEMMQVVSEIERSQKDINFNGIDIFKASRQVEIQSGEEKENNIFINTSKVTSTTLGDYMPTGQKSYNKCVLDGVTLGTAQVNAALTTTTEAKLANQIIEISSAADVRRIEINSALGNNTVDGVLGEIENLKMDGIRECSAVTYATFQGFQKNELNGTEGDMVQFDYNIGGTSVVSSNASFLIGANEAETRANLDATLDRIIRFYNRDVNQDADLSRENLTLKSELGKSISIGNFQLIDNPGIVIGSFGNTPVNPGGITPAYIPASQISFDVDSVNVSFTHTGNAVTDMNNAAAASIAALTGAGVYYDRDQYAADLDYASPDDRAHFYTVRTNPTDNTVVITKINLTSTEAATPAGNLLNITDFSNNQTHVDVANFNNAAGELITLDIEGTKVTFTAAGTANQALNATNLASAVHTAGITGIDAYVNGNTAVITRTNSEQPIDIAYDDEDNNVIFSGFSIDIGATINVNIDGVPLSYVIGSDAGATAANLQAALGGLGGSYNVVPSGNTVRLFKYNNTPIVITGFGDDGQNNALLGPISNSTDGETISFTYRRSGMDYPVSFLAGPTTSDTASNMTGALAGLGVPNTSFTLMGDKVRTVTSDNLDFRISNLAGSNPLSVSMAITPEAGSTAGAGSGIQFILAEGALGVTVTDIPSSVGANAGPGSATTNSILTQTNTGATITDQRTELTATAGAGSTNTSAAKIYKESGMDVGTVTQITASRATGTGSSLEDGATLENGPLGKSDTLPFNFLEDDSTGTGDNDHITVDRINAGLRDVGLGGVAGGSGTIDSQHAGADPNRKWSTVTGTGEFILDPNISMCVRSSVDGTSGSSQAGAFNAKANEYTNLLWSSSFPTAKALISDFDNVAGETISFSINDVPISFAAQASQASNANFLNQALISQVSLLSAAGITFERTSNKIGVYVYGKDGAPITFDNYSGSGAGNSGFDVWNIDSPFTTKFDESGSAVEVKCWTPLSQINYKTQLGASTALKIVDAALVFLQKESGNIGSVQNVLQGHGNFIDIEAENTVAMQSRIADVSVDKEMTELAKNEVLTQVATSMLSQANSLPKMVMQIIQGS